MWGGDEPGEEDVTCIACDATVERSAAREYDKYGDRFEREGKSFEHLCKACHRELCHQPREDLEAALVDAEATGQTPAEFAGAYLATVRDGSTADTGERER